MVCGQVPGKTKKDAFDLFLKAAQKGSTHSQFNLANMYNMANGVPRDIEKERYWYHKAARQDNVSAQFNLGMIVLERKELPLALYWIRKAAKSGSPKATIFLKPMESSISTNCHSCKAKLVDAPSASRFITVIGTVRSTTGRFTKKIVSTRFWSRLY